MRGIILAGLVTLVAGCRDGTTPTSPTTPTTTTTPTAAPSVTEEFTGTVRVGGFSFYSFTITENGTVNLTLNRVGGAGVPSTVWLGQLLDHAGASLSQGSRNSLELVRIAPRFRLTAISVRQENLMAES